MGVRKVPDSHSSAHASWWAFPTLMARYMHSGKSATDRLSRPFLKIAITAVAISVAAILIALAVARGFQREIAHRAVGFVGHIQLLNLDANTSYEQHPIAREQDFLPTLRAQSFVRSVQPFALKPGILKTQDQMQGCVLKGHDSTVDLSFFSPFILRGRLPDFSTENASQEVMISQRIASALQLDTGDALTMYFVQQPPRARRFRITAIFDTQFQEFDETYIYADLRHIQSLNGWGDTLVGGYEVRVERLESLDEAYEFAHDLCGFTMQEDGTFLRIVDVRDKHTALFDWLALLDMNVLILLVLMLAVASVNMITALLIQILEKTRTIGLLKALGAQTSQIRALFILHSMRILGWGLLWGNIVGLGFSFLQWHFKWIKLDAAEYYMEHVPIFLDLPTTLWVNVLTAIITVFVLLVPSALIARVSPSESIRFE